MYAPNTPKNGVPAACAAVVAFWLPSCSASEEKQNQYQNQNTIRARSLQEAFLVHTMGTG